MIPIVLMLCAAQGLPQGSEPGRRETQNFRPSRRDDRFYSLRARPFGSGFDTDAALRRALDGLARQQHPDGSWESSVATTGVALLAFLDGGYTTWAQEECRAMGCRSGAPVPESRAPAYHRVIRRGVDFLRRAQEPDGFVGARGLPTSLRDHAIAARALCEAWGGSRLLILAEPAQRAIQALTVEPGMDDATVGWTATAFRSALTCWLPHSRTLRKQLALRRMVPPIEGTEDPHLMYWGTEALFRYDPGGRIWTRWAQSVVSTIRSQPDALPTMDAALRALTLTVVYQPTVVEASR